MRARLRAHAELQQKKVGLVKIDGRTTWVTKLDRDGYGPTSVRLWLSIVPK